jgi:hypothetical protein
MDWGFTTGAADIMDATAHAVTAPTITPEWITAFVEHTGQHQHVCAVGQQLPDVGR